MLDPSFFLNIPGPVRKIALQPGFKAPGMAAPVGFAPRPQEAPMPIPGLGMGMKPKPGVQPSTSGATMGATENDGLAGAVSGIQGLTPNADGSFTPPPMPADIGQGAGGAASGTFLAWLQRMLASGTQASGAAPRGLL